MPSRSFPITFCVGVGSLAFCDEFGQTALGDSTIAFTATSVLVHRDTYSVIGTTAAAVTLHHTVGSCETDISPPFAIVPFVVVVVVIVTAVFPLLPFSALIASLWSLGDLGNNNNSNP